MIGIRACLILYEKECRWLKVSILLFVHLMMFLLIARQLAGIMFFTDTHYCVAKK